MGRTPKDGPYTAPGALTIAAPWANTIRKRRAAKGLTNVFYTFRS